MEVDALDAIEALVAAGLGVSIVPLRTGAPAEDATLRRLPLPGGGPARRLVLVTRERHSRAAIAAALHAELVAVAETEPGAPASPTARGASAAP